MRKRQPQGLNRLSVAAIKHLETPGWHADGGGLYLEIDANGRKRWALRLAVNGKRRDFGLGPLYKVSLAEAREMAAVYRAKAYRGIDPIAEKKKGMATPGIPIFKDAAEQVHRQRAQGWSNGKHVDQWINTLRDHAFPFIGDMPVSIIATPDVLKVLAPIWNVKAETARRVRQRLSTVLEWARAAGFRSGDNPVELIGDALPRQKKTERQYPALPYPEVPAFIGKLRGGQAAPITKLAFEFLILTAARTTEARKARWDEVDWEAKTWAIPGHNAATGRRMKMERDHVVPLSARCLQILGQAKGLSKDHELIFPDDDSGRVMSENRFLVARDALGYSKEKCTPHGFRSSFRDWAAEETSFPTRWSRWRSPMRFSARPKPPIAAANSLPSALRSWRHGLPSPARQPTVDSVYVGPADRVGQTIYTLLDYGPGKPTSSLEKYLAGKSPEERAELESVLAHNARYAQGITSRAAFIEKTVEENLAFLGSSDETTASSSPAGQDIAAQSREGEDNGIIADWMTLHLERAALWPCTCALRLECRVSVGKDAAAFLSRVIRHAPIAAALVSAKEDSTETLAASSTWPQSCSTVTALRFVGVLFYPCHSC